MTLPACCESSLTVLTVHHTEASAGQTTCMSGTLRKLTEGTLPHCLTPWICPLNTAGLKPTSLHSSFDTPPQKDNLSLMYVKYGHHNTVQVFVTKTTCKNVSTLRNYN